MRASHLLWLVFLAASPAAAPAAGLTPDSLFARGCDLYESGDFASALGAFEAAGRGGLENAAVYYNLGNTCYRLGRKGMAVANYRRALMLSPRDQDILANLEFVRTMVGTRDTLAAGGLESPADLPLKWLSAGEIRLIFYVAYYLTSLSFLAVLFLQGSLRRRGIYALACFAVVAILSYALSAHGFARFRDSSEAVVTGEQVDLRSGPGNAFERIATLRDGVEVRLKSRSAMWQEVQLPTGEVGWLREGEIEAI